MTYIFIIFIGHYKTRLLESLKFWQILYPSNKLILIIGQEETSGEKKAEQIAREMKSELETPIFSVDIERISKLDLLEAISQLIKIIIPFKKQGYEILLNISGSLRIFTVVSLIVSYLSQSKLVSVIPKYDEAFQEIGIESHLEIPILPLLQLKNEQFHILTSINSGVDSVEDLVLRISPDCQKDKKKYQSERSRIAYYLGSLENSGFVARIREGKNVRTQLTKLGKLYSLINRKLID